eukprot:12112668-Alexandrium_andersonii.AAC.1
MRQRSAVAARSRRERYLLCASTTARLARREHRALSGPAPPVCLHPAAPTFSQRRRRRSIYLRGLQPTGRCYE